MISEEQLAAEVAEARSRVESDGPHATREQHAIVALADALAVKVEIPELKPYMYPHGGSCPPNTAHGYIDHGFWRGWYGLAARLGDPKATEIVAAQRRRDDREAWDAENRARGIWL